MEVLSLILRRNTTESNGFQIHAQCSKRKILNICFADDLFLFARGDVRSATILMDSLTTFKNISGLAPSLPKSSAFFCNVPDHTKQAILSIMSFEVGTLPVRYLGVPLISTRLKFQDCRMLVERMESIIDNWKSKSLSFAGRLQLINSVLSSMHIYWAMVFILPIRIINDLEKKMRNFLWSQGSIATKKSKVAWNSVCLPKYEGGLGIKRIADVNKALMARHIWSIINKRKSLWVQWIHDYKIKGSNFWMVAPRGSMSWGWRKLLQIRDIIRPFIWKKIGNGLNTFVWTDKWCMESPLLNFITPRMIANAGFNLNSKVADLIRDNQWLWPEAWYNLFPVLIHTPRIQVNDNEDRNVWKGSNGVETDFSSKVVWESLRRKQGEVDWVNVVWFSQCTPRHAFHLWLVFRNKLKTQDRMKAWEAGSETNLKLMCCPLCKTGIDSRSHLFFQCHFSLQVWRKIKAMANMNDVSESWEDIANCLIQRSKQKTVESVISRILVAAASYFIWQERNARLFTQGVRNVEIIADLIMRTVRLRLVTLRFKGQNNLLEEWRLPKQDEDEHG